MMLDLDVGGDHLGEANLAATVAELFESRG